MATQILMPALSPTMEEGTLAKWLVKEGDTVKSGDIMAEIETDKATMEFEAVDEGIVGKILVAEGTSGVKVNTPLAVLLEEGEDASAATAAPAPAAPAAAARAAWQWTPARGPCARARARPPCAAQPRPPPTRPAPARSAWLGAGPTGRLPPSPGEPHNPGSAGCCEGVA